MATSLLRRVQLRELRPRAQETPDSTVLIEPGTYTKSDGTGAVKKSTAFNSPSFPGVSGGTKTRYDLLCLDDTGNAVKVAGTEVNSPGDPLADCPAFPADKLVLAVVRVNEVSSVTINGTDITDVREFLNKGSAGNQGPQGGQGYQGNQGSAGTNGTDGFQGPQGSAGTDGAQGNQGVEGTGSQGPQGNQGWQGVDGSAGSLGAQGNQGWQGPPQYKSSAETITQSSHGFAAGDAIYRNAGSNIYAKAKANAAATAEAVGVVESVNGNDFTVVYSGRITGLSGLTDGSIYFLSDVTDGLLTTSDPSIGSISKPLLIATSATSGIVINMRGIQVSAAGSVRSGQTYKPASVTVSQTVFDLPWTYAVGFGLLLVFRNGILQVITTDYAETDSDTITLVTAITSTDEEMVFVRLPNPGPSQIYREVEAHTEGSGSPHLILDVDSDKVFTNEGSTAKNYHTLPAAVVGLTYTFIVQDSDGLRITASTGDTIRFLDQVSAAAGYAESTEVGSVATLVAINATEWVATFFIGTWTIT